MQRRQGPASTFWGPTGIWIWTDDVPGSSVDATVVDSRVESWDMGLYYGSGATCGSVTLSDVACDQFAGNHMNVAEWPGEDPLPSERCAPPEAPVRRSVSRSRSGR